MTEPCPCWLDVYNHNQEVHCCFRDVELDDCHLGVPPPCGHWHPDVPRPDSEAQLDLGLALVTQEGR